MHHTCYLSRRYRNATVQHENAPLPLATAERAARNKKVVHEGNRHGVIVSLIGSPQNQFKSLFCKLCLLSRGSCSGAMFEPILAAVSFGFPIHDPSRFLGRAGIQKYGNA
jgi:hypothetical protein